MGFDNSDAEREADEAAREEWARGYDPIYSEPPTPQHTFGEDY